MRRSAMAQSKYKIALLGDSVSYLGQASVLVSLVLAQPLTLGRFFWVMGGTSVLALIVEARGLGLERPSAFRATAQSCWNRDDGLFSQVSSSLR